MISPRTEGDRKGDGGSLCFLFRQRGNGGEDGKSIVFSSRTEGQMRENVGNPLNFPLGQRGNGGDDGKSIMLSPRGDRKGE